MDRLHSVFTVLQYGVNLQYRIYALDFNELHSSYFTNVLKHYSFGKTYIMLYKVLAIGRL